MKKVKSTMCRICESQCGLMAEIDRENNRILSIWPDKDHIASQGFSCKKGITFEDFRMSPDRLTVPLKRTSTKDQKPRFEPIPWSQAFKEIGGKIRAIRKNHGDDSTGLFFGNPISFSLLYPIFINAFTRGLNTSKFFNTGTLDCNNKFYVNDQVYGSGFSLTFPDIKGLQYLIIIGANPAVSKMSFINLPNPVQKLKDITNRGGQVIHINPMKTETARQVGSHYFIRPDSDLFFLLSFLNEILTLGQKGAIELPLDIIDTHMTGFEKLHSIVEPWPAEVTGDITGIDPNDLRGMVRDYLEADGAALYLSTGVNMGTNGTLTFWLAEVINAVTGNLDRLGGVQMGQGIFDYAEVLAKNAPPTRYSRINNTPTFMDALPAGIMADEILTPGDDQIKALFVVSGNPLLSSSNSSKFEKALKKLDLLVSIETVQNETADYADYILPGTHFAERPDIPFLFNSLCGTAATPWFQYVDELVDPPGEAKDELWILHNLGRTCKAPFFGSKILHNAITLGSLLKKIPVIKKALPDLRHLLLDLLCRATGMGSLVKLRLKPHGFLRPELKENNYLGKRILTKDKKIHLVPLSLEKLAAARIEESFRKHRETRNSLKLITRREHFTHNTWSHNHGDIIAQGRHTNYIYMHRDDAEARGILHLDNAAVTSATGTINLPVYIEKHIMPGTVAIPHGWGHKNSHGQRIARKTTGANVNILAPDGAAHIEPLSGMTQFTGIDVTVQRVDSYKAVKSITEENITDER